MDLKRRCALRRLATRLVSRAPQQNPRDMSHQGGAVRPNEVVAGYRFETEAGSEMELNGMVCEIIARAGTDHEQLDEPRFLVKFGDGTTVIAMAHELSPWFAT